MTRTTFIHSIFAHKTQKIKCTWHTGGQDRKAARAALITALNTKQTYITKVISKQEKLALASMARDDPPASSTAAAVRGKVGSEFET